MKKKLISLNQAMNADYGQVVDWHQHANPMLAQLLEMLRFNRRFVKARGAHLWDDQGQQYLDLLGGYGAVNLGHNHPKVKQALVEFLNAESPNLMQASSSALAGALATNLAMLTGLDNCFLCNSGAEAVEAAIKLARKATGKSRILYAEGAFHGKSLGALSVTGRRHYQEPFEPLIPECDPFPFNDLSALEEALASKNVAAVILEPIQGEGGIVLSKEGYLKGASELCKKYGALLILDEIQTGLGRTGSMFAFQEEGFEPDILTLAKSLSGSYVPIGALLSKKEWWKKAYGSLASCTFHTSTFGGNGLACAAALTTLEVIEEEQLAKRARELGDYLLKELRVLAEGIPLIQEVRGKGLLIGIEFAQPKGLLNTLALGKLSDLSQEYLGAMIAAQLMNEHHIISAYTLNNPNVIRLEPPLVIEKEDIDKAITSIGAVMAQTKSFWGATVKTLTRGLRGRRKIEA